MDQKNYIKSLKSFKKPSPPKKEIPGFISEISPSDKFVIF